LLVGKDVCELKEAVCKLKEVLCGVCVVETEEEQVETVEKKAFKNVLADIVKRGSVVEL